jgi:hypothetical protein
MWQGAIVEMLSPGVHGSKKGGLFLQTPSCFTDAASLEGIALIRQECVKALQEVVDLLQAIGGRFSIFEW